MHAFSERFVLDADHEDALIPPDGPRHHGSRVQRLDVAGVQSVCRRWCQRWDVDGRSSGRN